MHAKTWSRCEALDSEMENVGLAAMQYAGLENDRLNYFPVSHVTVFGTSSSDERYKCLYS